MKIKSLLLLGLLTMTGMNAFADDYKVDGIWYTYASATANATVKSISSAMADNNAKTIIIPATMKDGDGNTHKVAGFEFTWATAEKDITGITETLEVDLANITLTDANISGLNKLVTLKLKKSGDYEVPVFTKIKNLDLKGISGTSKFKSAYTNASTILETIDATAATFDANVFNGQTKIKSVKNVKSVGNSAFGSAGAAGLEVTLLAEAEIGEAAFAASKLKTINMAMAKKIGADAFKMCTALTEANLSGAESVGSNAFNGSGVTTTLTIPASIKKDGIAAGAFSGMTLDNVAIVNNNIETIGKWFNGSTVKALTITSTSVKTIDTEAFENVSLQTVDLSGATALETIGTTAFNNNQLKAVKIPATVKTIGEMAFRLNSLADGVDFSEATALESIATKAFVSGTFTTIDLSAATALATVADDAFPQNAYTSVKLAGTALDNANFVKAQSWFGPATAGNSLEELTLPDALTTITNLNDYAKLTTIALPANLETIQDYAFTRSALTSIVIPAKVKTIGAYAFSECAALTSVDFSAATALETIGGYAFNKSGLTSVKIPATIKKINGDTFGDCAALESVDFSEAASLKEIADYAFYGSPKLVTLDLSKATALTKVYENSFPTNAYTSVLLAGSGLVTAKTETDPYDDGFSTPFKKILSGAKASLEEITLPAALTTIKEEQFKGFTALESISLPKATTTIEKSAFEGSGLTTVKIRENVTEIGSKAFAGSKLTSINFTEATALETIASGAFANLYDAAEETGLTSVAFPAKLQTIGAAAFTGCKLLETVDFSQAAELTEIKTKAFNEYLTYPATAITEIDLTGAVKLETVANDAFPQNEYTSVKLAGTQLDDAALNAAFNQNKILKGAKESLEEISFPEGYDVASFNDMSYFENLTKIGLPADLDEIPDDAFTGAKFTTYEVGANIKRVGKNAFKDSALESIDFTKATALTEIDNYAFYGTPIETVGLPKNLETIGENAFEKSALKSIKIKSHVKTIGAYAFNDCAKLENVNFEDANALTTIGGLAFGGTNLLTTIDLDGATKLTSISDSWGDAFAANEYTSVKTAGTLLAGIDEATDAYYDHFSTPFAAILANSTATLAEITLPAGLEKIADGTYAPVGQFKGFTALESISLPKAVTTIGNSAFENSGLKAIKIRENVKEIGEAAFKGSKLTSVNFTDGTDPLTIGTAAFANLYDATTETGLTSVAFPANLQTIGTAAFTGCKLLASADFSQAAELTTIGVNAFNEFGGAPATALTAIDLSACAKLATVYESSFPKNYYTSVKLSGTALTSLEPLKAWLSAAEADGVSCKTTLTEVTLPANVTEIPNEIFKGFVGLTSVSLPKKCTTIGAGAFAESGLTAFKVREAVVTIGNAAFADCENLTVVNFSEATKLEKIGNAAFLRAPITEVSIPANADDTKTLTIGPSAFRESKIKSFSAKSWAGVVAPRMFEASKLNGIKFPAAITGIGENAFADCNKLASVVFQYGAKDPGLTDGIDDFAFANCVALTSLDLSTTKLVSLDGDYVFTGCTALAEITFPEELGAINSADGIFADCPIENFEAPNLTTSPILFGMYYDEDGGVVPPYVLRDADNANTTLKTVTIGGTIAPNSFRYCTALESVEWIDNGGQIAASAFDHATGLKTFTFEPEDEIMSLVVNDNAFLGCIPFVDFVTNENYMDYIVSHHDGIAPTNTTFGDSKPTIVTTVQDKANANQFVAKYVNNGKAPVSIDAAEAKVYSIYVDGDAAYFQACRTFDGKYLIQPASEDRGNHVIIVTTEAKDVAINRESRRLLYTYSGQTSIAFDDIYDSKADDDLAAVQAGAGVTAGTYLYRLTNTSGQGFGFTFFKSTNIKEGQFFVACGKKPEGAGRLNVVWLDENGNVEEGHNAATGIETIENSADNEAIFNMQGVRVEKAQKGIYIQNGKKIVVK